MGNDVHTKEKLGGKYVITCISSQDGEILYYKDRSVEKKSFWTKLLSEAYGFFSKISAYGYCKRMRYNHPKVKYVDPGTLDLKDV